MSEATLMVIPFFPFLVLYIYDLFYTKLGQVRVRHRAPIVYYIIEEGALFLCLKRLLWPFILFYLFIIIYINDFSAFSIYIHFF